jgi:undecaprenyl diphosphate synthase
LEKILSELESAHQLKHLAIIMDGNNRWARQRSLPGTAGHKAGIERLRDMLKGCDEHNIDVLTVFAFSSENWQRPPKEVSALMSLFKHYLSSEAKKLKKEGVRLRVIGNRERFDKSLLKAIEKAELLTIDGERSLVIAADYGGRWDIATASKKVAELALGGHCQLDDIDENLLHKYTALADLPPLDLLIRTGGEFRISNFLLWQAAYAELYFSDLLWPDFDRIALDKAVDSFSRRERRFGLNGEQLQNSTDKNINTNKSSARV